MGTVERIWEQHLPMGEVSLQEQTPCLGVCEPGKLRARVKQGCPENPLSECRGQRLPGSPGLELSSDFTAIRPRG